MQRSVGATKFQSVQKMKFTKTETEYNMKSLRFLLLTITTMFIIIAGLMIVMGISVYSHYHSFSFFYESAKSGRFFTPSILSVLLGLVILVVTSFGFFGTLKQSTCMVNLYALILGLILVVKLVVVILAFTTNTDNIMRYINIPVWQYTSEPEIQGEIDQLQITLNCCGSYSPLDYVGLEFSDHHSTVMIPSDAIPDPAWSWSLVVPDSCCMNPDNGICTRPRRTGCKEALVNVIVQNAGVLGVLGVSVMFIQLLGIIFALLLARCIRKLKSEKALMAWKVKEQMILARQAAEEQKTDEEKNDAKKNESNTIYIDHPDSSVV